MRAKLKDLHFSDLGFGKGEPSDLGNFGEPIDASIGAEASNGADHFSATVCSPSWLNGQRKGSGAISGRHMLIGSHFDRAKIAAAIESFCASCVGATWNDVVVQVQRFGGWEFALYDVEKQGRPTGGSFGRLMALDCPDLDLAGYWPNREDSFRLPLRITLGGADGQRADFELVLSTPNQVIASAAEGKFVLGHGHLIVADYDLAKVRDAIRHTCEHLWGNTWGELVIKMAEYARPSQEKLLE
jgi:hypothetical protein